MLRLVAQLLTSEVQNGQKYRTVGYLNCGDSALNVVIPLSPTRVSFRRRQFTYEIVRHASNA